MFEIRASASPCQEDADWEWQLHLHHLGRDTFAWSFRPEATGKKMQKPVSINGRGSPSNPALVGIAAAKASWSGGPGEKGDKAKPLPKACSAAQAPQQPGAASSSSTGSSGGPRASGGPPEVDEAAARARAEASAAPSNAASLGGGKGDGTGDGTGQARWRWRRPTLPTVEEAYAINAREVAAQEAQAAEIVRELQELDQAGPERPTKKADAPWRRKEWRHRARDPAAADQRHEEVAETRQEARGSSDS